MQGGMSSGSSSSGTETIAYLQFSARDLPVSSQLEVKTNKTGTPFQQATRYSRWEYEINTQHRVFMRWQEDSDRY